EAERLREKTERTEGVRMKEVARKYKEELHFLRKPTIRQHDGSRARQTVEFPASRCAPGPSAEIPGPDTDAATPYADPHAKDDAPGHPTATPSDRRAPHAADAKPTTPPGYAPRRLCGTRP